MAIVLEGGCSVSRMNDGHSVRNGSMLIWNQIGRDTGAQAISLRLLEFEQGVSPVIQNREADEVFYFLEQIEGVSKTSETCLVHIDGKTYEVGSQTGLYLRPDQTMLVENRNIAPGFFVSVQCPVTTTGEVAPAATSRTPAPAFSGVRLADKAAIPTADRWYRVLVDDEVGSQQVTQFVGSIPSGRAPDHFHQYEEVLFILRGQGRMWAGKTTTSIGPGSCIYLPKGQVHCVENTGTEELRLLGVFYPAGSPSIRYEV